MISETTYRKAGLRCVLKGGMALCVMTPGTTKMPQWCADNLDSLLTVHSGRMHDIVRTCWIVTYSSWFMALNWFAALVEMEVYYRPLFLAIN